MTIRLRGVALALPILALDAFRHGTEVPLHSFKRFAAPQVIVANGGPLKHRVILADFQENLRLMLAASEVATVSVTSLHERSCVRIAMYWGHQWEDKLDLPDSVTPIAASNGAQAGAFCPASRGRPAIWLFGAFGLAPASPRRLTVEGLSILSKHRIPTKID